MARDKNRTGCGAGFADDRVPPGMEIVERGELDYLAMQCLAECTIARETLDRAKDPGKGYTLVLLERMEAIMPPALQHGIKIVTNGGGQSHGCFASCANMHPTEAVRNMRAPSCRATKSPTSCARIPNCR